MTGLLRFLHLVQPLLTAVALVFLAVFVGCWVGYGIGCFQTWRGLRRNQHGVRRQRGEQPLCEFTAGPEGNGLRWHDEVMVQVVEEFERDLGMGGGVR